MIYSLILVNSIALKFVFSDRCRLFVSLFATSRIIYVWWTMWIRQAMYHVFMEEKVSTTNVFKIYIYCIFWCCCCCCCCSCFCCLSIILLLQHMRAYYREYATHIYLIIKINFWPRTCKSLFWLYIVLTRLWFGMVTKQLIPNINLVVFLSCTFYVPPNT